jgi:regulator of cell morphogenesis and NO signaling
MVFRENTNLADIIHCNYLLLPILNRFDIQLGFGDKTVKEVCKEHNINIDFFLEIVNSFHDPDYFPQAHLQAFSLKIIINYIKKAHIYYLDYKVPQIEALIHHITELTGNDNKRAFSLIEQFFGEYKNELKAHILDEENRIHPYVLALESAYLSKNIEENHRRMVHENPIEKYAAEHSNIEDKLYDLKTLIIKYLPPSTDYTLSNTLLIELFRLERDLNDHSRIEDKVLIPKVQHIENQILKIGK